MTHTQKLSLVLALASTASSPAASVPKTILPDNVITCQPNANCINKTLYGRTYRVINTPRFTVMLSVSEEGAYTRADVSIANNGIYAQSLTPEDFRVEVLTPKPKVLLYVPPSDLKDLVPATPAPPAPQAAPPSQTKPSTPTPAPETTEAAAKEPTPQEIADKATTQKYLAAVSLPPNEVTIGRVYFEREKHEKRVNIVLPIAGLVFEFPYTIQ
jgi:hypothetical protein